jgi:Mg2+/Co2+ transporter CorB
MAETSLLSINRYRLRHEARSQKNYAQRPDRLLGMVLIGNNIANIVASAIATVVTIQVFGDHVIASTLIIAVIILIFAEVLPKTLAALYSEKIARVIAWPVYIFLMVFYPLVFLIGSISNGLIRLVGIRVDGKVGEALSREELRSIVYDTAGKLSRQYRNMLLGILDLNKVYVDDVMIPKHKIYGINIDQEWDSIQIELAHCSHAWIPVYRDNIDNVIGILHVRDLTKYALEPKSIDKNSLLSVLQEPYFVPISTPLNTQLLQFQKERKRMALTVNEYGDIQGLITLEDILEEIVGEITTDTGNVAKLEMKADGSYLVDGSISLRELNKVANMALPTDGPRTLNGLITEYLESLPHIGVGVKIDDYPIEIIEVDDNRVSKAIVFPRFMS